jgi:hypothetical protein
MVLDLEQKLRVMQNEKKNLQALQELYQSNWSELHSQIKQYVHQKQQQPKLQIASHAAIPLPPTSRVEEQQLANHVDVRNLQDDVIKFTPNEATLISTNVTHVAQQSVEQLGKAFQDLNIDDHHTHQVNQELYAAATNQRLDMQPMTRKVWDSTINKVHLKSMEVLGVVFNLEQHVDQLARAFLDLQHVPPSPHLDDFDYSSREERHHGAVRVHRPQCSPDRILSHLRVPPRAKKDFRDFLASMPRAMMQKCWDYRTHGSTIGCTHLANTICVQIRQSKDMNLSQ